MEKVVKAMIYLAKKQAFELNVSMDDSVKMIIGDIELEHIEVRDLILQLVGLVGNKKMLWPATERLRSRFVEIDSEIKQMKSDLEFIEKK